MKNGAQKHSTELIRDQITLDALIRGDTLCIGIGISKQTLK